MADELSASLDLDLGNAEDGIDDLGDRIDKVLADAEEAAQQAFASLADPIEIQLEIPGLAEVPDTITTAIQAADTTTDQLVLPGLDETTADISAAVDAADVETEQLVLPGIEEVAADIGAAVEAADTTTTPLEIPGLEGDIAGEISSAIQSADTTTSQLELPGIDEVTHDIEAAVDAADMTTVELEVPGLEEATAGLEGLSGAAEGVSASTGGAQSGLEGLGGAAEAFGLAAGASTGSTGGLVGTIGRLGPEAVIAGGAILAGVGAVKAFTSEAIDSESATQRFKQALGDMRGQVENIDIGGLNTNLSELSLTLGSDDDSLRKVAASLFELQTNAGKSREEAAQFTEQVIALGARVAALRPEMGTLDQTTKGLERAFFRGGRFAARFGLDLGTAADITQRAAEQTGKLAGDLTYADKVAAGASIAFEKYGKNLDEIVAKGAENAAIKHRSLQQAFKETMEDMGRPLIVPLFKIMEEAQPVVEETGRIVSLLAEAFMPLLSGALEVVAPLLKVVADVLEAIPTPVLTAAIGLAALPKVLGLVSSGFFGLAEATGRSGGLLTSMGFSASAAGTGVQTFGKSLGSAAVAGAPLIAIAAGALYALGAFGDMTSDVNVKLAAHSTSIKALREDLGSFAERTRQTSVALDGARANLIATSRATKDTSDSQIAALSASSSLQSSFATLQEKTRLLVSDARDLARVNPEAAATLLQEADAAGLSDSAMRKLSAAVEEGTAKHEKYVTKKAEAAGQSAALQAEIKAESDVMHMSVNATTAAATALDGFVQTAVSTLPTLSSVFDQTASDMEAFFNKPMEVSPEALNNSLQGQIQAVTNFQANIATLYSLGLDNIAQLVIEKGPQIGGAFASQVLSAEPGIRDALESNLGTYRTKTDEYEAFIRAEAGPRLVNVWTEFHKKYPTISHEQWQAAITGAQADGETLATEAGNTGTKATTNYETNLKPVVPKTADIFGLATGEVEHSGVPLAGGNAGKGTSEGFGEGVSTVPSHAIDAFSIAGDIVNQQASILGSPARISGLAIGSQMGGGINDGLNQWSRTINNTARQIVQDAVQAAKNAGSPSYHLFFDAGTEFMVALDDGMTKAGQSIASSSKSAVRAIAEAANNVSAPSQDKVRAGGGGPMVGQIIVQDTTGNPKVTAHMVARRLGEGGEPPVIFTLGGINFDAEHRAVDDNGVSWGLDVPEGWWDTPELRTSQSDLPLRDGASVGNSYRSACVVELRGGIVHNDPWVTTAAIAQLTAALDIIRTDGILIAVEQPEAKALTVRRASPIDVTWVGAACTWETTLVAADWRKYSLAEDTLLLGPYTAPSDGIDLSVDTGPDSDLGIELNVDTGPDSDLGIDFTGTPGANPDMEAVNRGTASVYPVVEFRGPSSASMTSFKVTNLTTGGVLQIDTTVNAGESLFADMAAAYGISVGSPVLLGGVSRYGGWVSPRTPWYIAPGTNLLRFQVLAGTATGASARVTWRSGWE